MSKVFGVWVILAGLLPCLYGDLVITEVMYDTGDHGSAWEWIEIHNTGAVSLNLSGYVLDDDDGDELENANITSGMIEAGGTAIIFNGRKLSIQEFESAWGTGLNLIAATKWSSFGNRRDKISIWNSFSSYEDDDEEEHLNALATIEYNRGNDQDLASLYLTNPGEAVGDGSVWNFSSSGTPGVLEGFVAESFESLGMGSPGVIPEPAVLSIILLGGGVLLGMKRLKKHSS